MESYEIVILVLVCVLALCGILEIATYIIRKRYTNEETGEIINESDKFDTCDTHLLINAVLSIIYFRCVRTFQ